MSEINYIPSGDHLIPDLTQPEMKRPISKYGRMRRTFLQKNRPILFNFLVLTGKLFPHLLEIGDAADRRLEQLMDELVKQNGVTEALKASDQMKWVGMMNNLKAQAEEVILNELIYS